MDSRASTLKKEDGALVGLGRFIFLALLVILFCMSLKSQVRSESGYFAMPTRWHLHTTCSDGRESPSQVMARAVKDGVVAIFPADHLDQVLKKCGSLEKYFNKWSNPPLCKDGQPLIVVPGVEIGAKTDWGNSHILAWFIPSDLPDLSGKPQGEVIAALFKAGAISVAAHPSMQNYYFDKNKVAGLSGIEMWNDGSPGSLNQYLPTTRDWILSLWSENFFVMTGADTHGWGQEDERNSRITWVLTKTFDRAGLLEALRHGRTYITNQWVFLNSFDTLPGLEFQSSKYVFAGFQFNFASSIKKKHALNFYLDGLLLKDYQFNFGPSPFNFWGFSIEFSDLPRGKHSLFIEVDKICFTSAIRFESTDSVLP